MTRSTVRLAFLVGLCLAGAASAQDMRNAEIVVTASKYADSTDVAVIPHITLPRRADFVITRINVVCDTRDLAQRTGELRTTLRGMMAAADADPSIALSLGYEVLGELSDPMLDELIVDYDRPDTSHAELVLKTAVSPDDTLDTAKARLKAFIDKVEKAGRTEVLSDERWDLTIIGPERNRQDLIRLIADDAKQAAAQFGPSYGVTVEGLQGPIEWYQTAPLELSLYIPYVLKLGSSGGAVP